MPEILVGAAQVDQIGRVDGNGPDSCVGQCLPECLERLGLLLAAAPRGRVVREHLDRSRANLARSFCRFEHALLGGECLDLTLDANSFANGEGDGVQDLGEVAADLVVDRDGRGHQLEVVRLDATRQVGQRVVQWQTEVDLADDARELG